VTERNENSKGVRAIQIFVGNFDWAFAWSFAVRGKEKKYKTGEKSRSYECYLFVSA
jgi:hypothetical protein